jgi:hypothetical protein
MYFSERSRRRRKRKRRRKIWAKGTGSSFIRALKTVPSKIALVIYEILRTNP